MTGDAAATDVDRLRRLADEYPAFALPAALLLKNHRQELTDKEAERLSLHLAVTSGDRKAIYDIVSPLADDFRSIYPPEIKQTKPSTDSAIDTFFANYGTGSESENALLERLIFNPVPDYTEMLEDEAAGQAAPAQSDETGCRIDAFLRDFAEKPKTPASPREAVVESIPDKAIAAHENRPAKDNSEPAADGSTLSESLAKIFIKQGRYERAYEIIYNLSLNYPKKSIYFADQLRFLQKLIRIKAVMKPDASDHKD